MFICAVTCYLYSYLLSVQLLIICTVIVICTVTCYLHSYLLSAQLLVICTVTCYLYSYLLSVQLLIICTVIVICTVTCYLHSYLLSAQLLVICTVTCYLLGGLSCTARVPSDTSANCYLYFVVCTCCMYVLVSSAVRHSSVCWILPTFIHLST
jgi:hypothetical protein